MGVELIDASTARQSPVNEPSSSLIVKEKTVVSSSSEELITAFETARVPPCAALSETSSEKSVDTTASIWSLASACAAQRESAESSYQPSISSPQASSVPEASASSSSVAESDE